MSRTERVGEGATACGFVPAPSCTLDIAATSRTTNSTKGRGRPQRLIGKVFPHMEDMVHEWDITRPLARLDPMQEHLVYPIARCITTRGQIAHRAVARCTLLSPLIYHPELDIKERDQEPIGMLRAPYHGPDLYQQLRKGGRRITLRRCLGIIYQIAQGIQLLSSAGLLHNDIKADNVVIGRDGAARLIDFGSMVRRAGVFDPQANLGLGDSYWAHPPEYRLVSYLYEEGQQRGAQDDSALRALMRAERAMGQVILAPEQKQTLWDLMPTHDSYAYDYNAMFAAYASRMATGGPAALYSYAKRYANRVDVYGLGLLILFTLSYVQIRPSDATTLDQLRPLLVRMVSPDPRKRPSPRAVVAALEGLIGAIQTKQAATAR